MEHGHVSPNLETEPSEHFSVEGSQDEGVDTNIAGPSESKESVLIKLEINQSIETTKLKNNNDNVETLEFGNNIIIETTIQDKKSEKNHYICKYCSKVFDKHQALGGHMNGHSKDQRNLEKFGKVTTWIHETYPPPLNTTLASEIGLQGTPINGVAYSSYNHLVEVSDVYSQLGRQWTTQQSTHQTQLPQRLETQQRQQLQNYQAQEPQSCQSSQEFQSNEAPERPQSTQALPGLQNYQTLQGLQNYLASQGSQNNQTRQQFQNNQTQQGPQYYQASQGSQYYQTSQGSQNYQAPQGPQSYQTPQRFQNHQPLQGPQSYQTPRGSQSYQAPQGPQSYQTPQKSQQQLVVDANKQQKINLNSKISKRPTSLAKVPSNEQKNISSNTQVLHFQEEVQGPQKYMPNPHNLHNGDCLTTGPFINEQLNKKYYAQLGPNVLRRSNKMITTPHNFNADAQYRPANSPNTRDSFNQSNVE